jgi:copper chaperone CopZ
MKVFLIIAFLCFFMASEAQVSRVSLQASGLTCSMCSKAVKNALEKVDNVEKVQVDIKNQQYNLSFRDSSLVNLDALAKAVEDAGFSVAKLEVTATVAAQTLEKDQHILIGSSWFHFLNAARQQVGGEVKFTLVDQNFMPAKESKKYRRLSRMECVQTGRSASCCSEDTAAPAHRIYHAII